MCSTSAITACYIILVSAAVLGAPLTNKQNEVQKRSAGSAPDTPDQEKDLQDLLNLVHKESKQDGVVVHKEAVSHFENNNGQKVQVQAKEEKVVDKNTGSLIADVKQEVKQQSTGSDTKPETVVATKVDIPGEGVHETFVQDVQETNAEAEETGEEPELTPADMAEYLYATQRFPAFYAALERLVNQSKMTPEEAELYTKAVALEYEKFQLEDFEERVMAEKRLYPQISRDVDVYGEDNLPDGIPHSSQDLTADELYRYGYPGSLIQEEQLNAQQEMQGNLDFDPYEFLAALWNEAYGKGNEEAQEIVKMLYDRVSQDDNPDDMGQIRDLLVETIAASMNEEPFNVRAEAAQEANPENPLSTQEKVKQEVIKAVEQVRDDKQKLEKQAIMAEQKEIKEQKVTEKTGKPADKQKQ